MGAKVRKASRLAVWPLISLPVMVTSATWPASTWVMNSLNLTGVSFFWIWAKCQARKTTTRRDIHSMTVLNVAFTFLGPPDGPHSVPRPRGTPGGITYLSLPPGRLQRWAGRGMVPMKGSPRKRSIQSRP